jgi:DNA-binding GntR family transcriptional regulator
MRRKLSDDVRRHIEEDIASGVLEPGARLDEQSIALKFGISRTPAREALLQLSMAGLVRLVPRRGAIVAGHSARDAISLFEVLVVLEAEAARLAARRMTSAMREELRQAHEGGRGAASQGSESGYAKANAAFHALIYAGASNDYLVQQIKMTRGRLRAYRRSGFETASRIRNSHDEHGRVMEAIVQGDDVAAHEAMVQHIGIGGQVFADVIAAMPSV